MISAVAPIGERRIASSVDIPYELLRGKIICITKYFLSGVADSVGGEKKLRYTVRLIYRSPSSVYQENGARAMRRYLFLSRASIFVPVNTPGHPPFVLRRKVKMSSFRKVPQNLDELSNIYP